MSEKEVSRTIKFIIVFMVTFSIFATYQVMVVDKNFVILVDEDGPDTSDYFE